MREKVIELHLVKRAKELGCEVRKVKWIGRRGAPDRVVFFPRAGLFWIELKTMNGKISELQAREHYKLRSLGQKVYVLSSIKEVDEFFEHWR